MNSSKGLVNIAIESYKRKLFFDGYISRFVFADGSAVPAYKSMYSSNVYYAININSHPVVLAILAENENSESMENEWKEAEENEYENLKKLLNLRKLEYKDITATITLYVPVFTKSRRYGDKLYSFYELGKGLGILQMRYRAIRTAKMDYSTFLIKRQIAEKIAEKGVTVRYRSEEDHMHTKYRILFYVLFEIKEVSVSDVDIAVNELSSMPLSEEEVDMLLKSSIVELKSKLLDT